jgi:Ca2+:H+ antiporter
MIRTLRQESGFIFGAATAIAFWLNNGQWIDQATENNFLYTLLFAWVFAAIMALAFSVVRHAETLAHRLGEPYGTLILTISVISIEVAMIAAVMLTGQTNPTLARDTMFAVFMIVLGGMIGISLLVGGWRHSEQEYNLKGANAFMSVIIPLSILGLVLPRFTTSPADASASPLLSVALILMSLGLYAVFLGIQTVRHKQFFIEPVDCESDSNEHGKPKHLSTHSLGYHIALLLASILPVVYLSKKIALLLDHAIVVIGAPQAIGGVLVAILVLAPEGLSALKSAWNNRLQRTVNLCLGSALATICLTIPAVLIVGFIIGQQVQLGLENQDLVLLLLTLVLSMVTFGSGRTNVLQGAVHLIVFAIYLVLIFD